MTKYKGIPFQAGQRWRDVGIEGKIFTVSKVLTIKDDGVIYRDAETSCLSILQEEEVKEGRLRLILKPKN